MENTTISPNIKFKSSYNDITKDINISPIINSSKDLSNECQKINTVDLKRCNHPECNKKLKLTDIKCRCGFKFCAEHRYSDIHNCTFDYKNMGKIELTKQNPIVNFSKLEKLT
tara:strand:+ start:72 stop:410 length:339 start_codon:yes stop_codon:yes gene_type:complete